MPDGSVQLRTKVAGDEIRVPPAVRQLRWIKPFRDHGLAVTFVTREPKHPAPWANDSSPTGKSHAPWLPLTRLAVLRAVAEDGEQTVGPRMVNDGHVQRGGHFGEERIPADGDPDLGLPDIEDFDAVASPPIRAFVSRHVDLAMLSDDPGTGCAPRIATRSAT